MSELGVAVADAKARVEKIIANVEKVIRGKHQEVELAVICLLCRGHLLIEDIPGVGKTVLAKSLALSVSCSFKRIQFTPDLLPSDITGVSIYNQKTGEFEFRPGPIMAQIVLTDEVNRATPKTQAALLECMEERQVTVDGRTYTTPHPFLVIATLNPIEYEGTFPLPEAELDRFLLRLRLGYPPSNVEVTIMEEQQYAHPIESLEPVLDVNSLLSLQEVVKGIYVDKSIKHYIVALVEGTRKHSSVYLGASPRGSLALFRASQARALVKGRDYVLPDDVKALAGPALAHRILIQPSARMSEMTSDKVVADVLEKIPVPGARVGRWLGS